MQTFPKHSANAVVAWVGNRAVARPQPVAILGFKRLASS
jgi:hypothetical protein